MNDSKIPKPRNMVSTISSTSYSNLSFSVYSELIKSKQTFLLCYTTVFAYLISSVSAGFVLSDFLWITVGMFFAVSGSTMLNMYIDRDIDAIMERTKDRLIPSGKIPPSTVLKHGFLWSFAGILATGVFIDLITMFVVFLGFFFDVVVYSLLLKRRTKFSIIFGGIAGGLPALAGRVAAVGMVDLIGILMGLFVLLWIPLHILTLALLPKNLIGYKDAGVPMWPVVASEKQTIRVITLSAILSVSVIVLTGIALNINIIVLSPLIVFAYIFFIRLSTTYGSPIQKQLLRFSNLLRYSWD